MEELWRCVNDGFPQKALRTLLSPEKLKWKLVASANKLWLSHDWIFQQDSDPKPDLNPAEELREKLTAETKEDQGGSELSTEDLYWGFISESLLCIFCVAVCYHVPSVS